MRHRILVSTLAMPILVGCVRSGSDGERHGFEGPFRQVIVNSRHTCLLATDGSVRCFGGDDTRDPPMTPIPEVAFRKLVSARRSVCGIGEDDGSLACFGACISVADCKPPPGSFEDLALHDDRGGCAWDSKHTQCWGDEEFLRFIAPPAGWLTRPVREIVFGADWSLIHYADGTLAPYGGGKPSDQRGVWNDPLLIEIAKSGEVVADIAGKGAAACVIDLAGTPRCVAYYENPTPAPIEHALAIEFSAPMGAMPVCVLAAASAGERSGSVTCTANVLGKQLHLPGRSYTQLAVGDHHICGLDGSGDVECIGSDRNGAVTGRRPWP